MRWTKLVALLIVAGCDGQECTAIGCLDQVHVTFSKPIDVTGEGFMATVEAEGVVTTCFVGAPTATCTRDGLSVVVRDSVLRDLRVDGKPKQLKVTITSPAGTLASGDITPKYEPVYPNGEDCGEGCEQAEATL